MSPLLYSNSTNIFLMHLFLCNLNGRKEVKVNGAKICQLPKIYADFVEERLQCLKKYIMVISDPKCVFYHRK